MALVLAVSALPGGSIVSRADEIPEEVTGGITGGIIDETAKEPVADIEEEIAEELPEEIPDAIPDETATYELEYREENEGSLTISGIRGVAGGELVIPARINDVPVTVISENAFVDCRGFTGKLVIPEGVGFVNNNAFKDCSGLESISLPASLNFGIQASVTEGCSGLREVINNSDKTCWLNEGDFTWVDKATGKPLEKNYYGDVKLVNGTAVTDGGYCKPYADAAYALKYRISGEEISIIGCIGNMRGKLVIPERIGERCVTTIGDNAFIGGGFLKASRA
ncbi:MAG: leucine-rich repeat domain-containing protein [Lachnospiraceae bacterium]|nr:leucine-rich repeat domain-containing protein [Lachnospiraceae bacterium]